MMQSREQEASLTSQKISSQLEVKVWAESTVVYDAVAVPMGHV